MAQTIRLTYEAGLTPTLKLYDSAGDAVGEAAGYAMTEVADGEYQNTTVADGLSGSPLVAVLLLGAVVEATDYVWLSGTAGSVAIVGVQDVDLEPVLSALGNLPSAAEIRTELDDNSTKLAAIVADTNELQSNQGNWLTADVSALATSASLATVAGYLDTEIAAILADTNELQTNQGNWVTPVLSGDNTLTFLVQTTGEVAIPNASVRVYNATGDSETKTTNASGSVSFAVEDDTWFYSVRASNFVGEVDSTSVGANKTVTVQLTAKSVAANADPALSNAQLRIIDQHGLPVANEPVFAIVEGKEFASDSFVKNRMSNGITDSDGYVLLELIQLTEFSDGTGVYRIDVGSKGPDQKSFRINAPSQSSVNITGYLT